MDDSLAICKITARMCGKEVLPDCDDVVFIVGKVDDEVDAWRPLTDAGQAMECLEELRVRAKVVIRMDSIEVGDGASSEPTVYVEGHDLKRLVARALAEIGRMEETR